MTEAEKEVRQMLEAGMAEELLTGYQRGQDLMPMYSGVCWMAVQPDHASMVSAQQFARNLMDEVGK